jgi:hypothetical protein
VTAVLALAWRWGRGLLGRSGAVPALLALAALVLCAGALTVDRWLDARDAAIAAEARISALEAELAARAEAAEILRAHNRRLAADAAARAALIRDLQSMEGADAPLSDFLRASGGRLWPADPRAGGEP